MRIKAKTGQLLFLLALVLLAVYVVLQFSDDKAAVDFNNEMSSLDGTVFINEVCSRNKTVIRDSQNNFSDYIELYNSSSKTVSLDGWYLSDDEDDLQKCQLNGVHIEANSYVIIYADGSGENTDSVSFKISSNGENLFLTDKNKNIVDNIYVPSLQADTAYARTQDGGEEWGKMEPSPLDSNNEYAVLRDQILDAPVFSVSSGFYDEPFTLELRSDDNATIYYTTDGSVPKETSEVYEEGIYIDEVSDLPNVFNSVRNVVEDWENYTPGEELADKAVVIRAVAMDNENNISKVVSATYFVGLPAYEKVDVISLVADPEDLFGDNGIHVTGKEYDEWYMSGSEEEKPTPNFLKGGEEWEITGNVELFTDGQPVLNQPAGLRIQGASSRIWSKKRFSVYAREEYDGSEYFNYELFENRKTHSFVLKPGNSDSYIQELAEGRDIASQSSRPVVVFLNGEYWYDAEIQEKYSKYYLADVYGVDIDNVIFIKDYNLNAGEEEDLELFTYLNDYVRNKNLYSEQEYEALSQIIDMQSFVDYMCANAYLCNMDMNKRHNHLLWRTRTDEGTEYGDGRWRWMLYDMDSIEWEVTPFYDAEYLYELNTFAQPMESTGQALDEHPIFEALRYNEIFRKQFVLTFMDMANTCFAPDRVEMELQKTGRDLSWNDGFFEKRFDYIVPYLAEEFSLEGTLEDVALEINDPDAGRIQLNTVIPDLKEGLWTGKYFTDFSIELKALPEEGYRFVRWEGAVTEEQDTIETEILPGGITIKAVFEKTN